MLDFVNSMGPFCEVCVRATGEWGCATRDVRWLRGQAGEISGSGREPVIKNFIGLKNL